MSRFVVAVYELLGGRLLGRTLLLLTTVGRRSGLPRTTALHYQLHDGVPVVCASNAGRPRLPAWLLNLRSDAHVTSSGARYDSTAVEPDDVATWERWIGRDPNYARLAGGGRRYPLVRLAAPPSG